MFSRHLFLIIVSLLVLSACSTRNTPAPVVESRSTVSVQTQTPASIKSSSYTVRKGETLYSIAWRANSDVRTIAKLNRLLPPYRIFPGQKLKISGNSSKPSRNKSSANNSTKSSGTTTNKAPKKAIATTKKQEYGKAASGQKISKKPATTASNFSQKIRRWLWPAKGKVIATFSTAAQGNKGIDIAGKRGDRITAAADGKVVYAGSALRGYGKLIIVKHNDDYLSAYAHNDELLVKEQQSVKAGDVIAKMGDTDAQRVMLHFEVRFRGKSVNPMKYLPKR
ncbi:peptidoglycan DD-metalloendopeptidase family protein [Thalassotalea euphylliae]|uniref:LysM peptidoglycan-binding domain-containing protein n=1 Tax=Thalassotalea euphylliae TaxID=1655234 RepID=A0A3E0U2N2_9GAMM|nr:peptidoglycan DD-metalloendopeptidase family protein [Thalassotalea euphylliae]REL30465.1 LysM peptidoglycan-binding domain-containing protein [Thalassotalea euphylliae]